MDFGLDFSGVEDIDSLLSTVSGESGLSFPQNVARRLSTPRGALFYDPEYGLDTRTFLSDTIPKGVAEAAIVAECLKDPRCSGATATITILPRSHPTDPDTWSVAVNLQNTAGESYDLVFFASAGKLSLLGVA